jgi:hypothetical protein
MRPLPPPLIPIHVLIDERLRVVPHALDRRAVGGGRAGAPAAETLIQHVVFVEVPRVAQAVLAHEFVARVVQVLQALVDVRTEETVLVVDDRARTLVTLLALDVDV